MICKGCDTCCVHCCDCYAAGYNQSGVERDQLRAEVERMRQAEERLRRHPMAPDRCPQCEWTNINLMNYGDTERSIWLCHGCAADVIRAALTAKGVGK